MRKTTDLNTLTPTRLQSFLYRNTFGRLILKLLITRTVSRMAGAVLNSKISSVFVKGFVKNNGIDLNEYEKDKFDSYNDFYTRKIRPELRPISCEKREFISPADSRLLCLDIDEELHFNIKNSYYSLSSFLGDRALADEFLGGKLLIFRLCVDDYHRYCFFDDGEILSTKFISGCLHTVQPIALERDDFFKENCREITVMQTENFGKAVMVEIGALMVGKIVNRFSCGSFEKGQEKGYFEFGGSTVCVLLKSGQVSVDTEIIDNTRRGLETRVLFGETIGKKQ